MKTITAPEVSLIWSTPDPRRQIAIAARMTYSAKPLSQLMVDLHEEEIAKSVNAILERRHYSVLRHVVFMFAVSGVSRAFSHQLVRHTAGHAYEQRSQHYRNEKDFNFILPDTINNTAPGEYTEFMESAQEMYDFLLQRGVPKEDARQALPNAVETMLVWTANLDAVMNFVKARACRVNVPEAMAVAIRVRNIVSKLIPETAPYLGPTCYTQGVCFEGDKFYKECRKPWKTPTVLWRPDFPRVIELVGVGGNIKNIDTSGIETPEQVKGREQAFTYREHKEK